MPKPRLPNWGPQCAAKRARRAARLRRRYGKARPSADRLPFHGGDCYACEQRATGFRDRRPEGGVLERACDRHKDSRIKTYDACMYCDGPVRRGSSDVDRDFAHKKCHELEMGDRGVGPSMQIRRGT